MIISPIITVFRIIGYAGFGLYALIVVTLVVWLIGIRLTRTPITRTTNLRAKRLPWWRTPC